MMASKTMISSKRGAGASLRGAPTILPMFLVLTLLLVQHQKNEAFQPVVLPPPSITRTGKSRLTRWWCSSSSSSSSRHLRPVSSVVVLRSSPSSSSSVPTAGATSQQQRSPSSPPPSSATSKPTSPLSDAAEWHKRRRMQMLEKYGDQIAPLERESSSESIGLPLLLLTNASLLGLAMASASLPIPVVVLLAIFPGSIFSLWQLQILHDVIHGSFLGKKGSSAQFFGGRTKLKRKQLQDRILFWGSMPSYFGYYLYLKFGHLTHHKNLGNPDHSLALLFDSSDSNFEDGDMLFVAHRMHLKGPIGPQIPVPFSSIGGEGGSDGEKKMFKMSISRSGFHFWKEGNAVWNATMFALSFMYERILLGFNDVVVSILGKNLFFPNKPHESFQKDCATYARCATFVRATLWLAFGWKSILFLYLSETLWSIPPHPACAMFVTNHGSVESADSDDGSTSCIPTSSTYAGQWYSILTLGTNFHCEHHDFPTIPFQELHQLRKIAPEFYKRESDDKLWSIMDRAFSHPQFYACLDAAILKEEITL